VNVEEEIDLRPYLEALIKHWYWIVGAAVLAGIVAFIATSFIPPTYEATALVAVVGPRDVFQFDDRIRETAVSQPLKAFPQLALSDQVLLALLEQNPAEDIHTIEDLRSRLTAEAGDDTSVIRLAATSQDPAEAMELVNRWASVFVSWANDIYSNQGGQQVTFFEDQLVEAEAELAAAEEALIEFQAINRTDIISNTLLAYANTQTEYLAAQQETNQLIQQVGELKNQLATQGNSQPVMLADQLTALALQLQAFDADTAVPLQLQVSDSVALTSASRAEQLVLLDSLLATLASQSTQIETELAALEPRILELQQQQQQAETEYGRLLRNQLVSEETYMALAHKVEQERITAQDTISGVRLASSASVPVEPVSPGRIVNTVVAALLGLVISGMVILLITWRNSQV
jgi:uncharacterized protein involved in exopolysaccharide biosynthesis